MRAANPAFRLDLMRSLKMHPVLALSITSISLVLLLLYGLTMKPMYEAEALLHVQPDSITLLDENPKPSYDSGKYDSFLQEQIQSMQRSDTITAALGRLPKHVWEEYGSSEEEATQQIIAKVKIARVSTSYQVSLMLKGSDRRNTTDLINAITYAYLDVIHKQNRIENNERAELLAEERQRIANELRRDQDEQSALSASLGLANPDGDGDPYEGELTALREQLVQAQSAHEAAAARMASLKGQTEGHNSALAAEADEAVLSDAGLSALKSSIGERRAALRGQMSGMTPDNPLRQRDQEELMELDHSLEEMTLKLHVKSERDLQEKLRADLQRTGDLEARIHSQLAQRTAAATNATPKLQRAVELNGDVKRLLLRQSEIENATRILQLEGNSPGAVRLTLAAQVPTSPEGNRKRLFLMASFPLALMFGAAAAAISHKCDPRMYTKVDVSDTLGFLPLATLPAQDEVSEAAIAEEVFRLTGAVTTAYRAKGVRVFLFTTVSAPTDIEPLSRILTEKLRKTGINASSMSSADLFLPIHADQRADPDCLRPEENNSLPPAQIGTQGYAERNLTLLKLRPGLVLVNASKPFECAETEYIARCADATILVVESAVTTKAELLQAAESAHRLDVPTIGVVLLEVRKRSMSRSTHETLGASRTPDHLSESSLQEQAPLPKRCEAMPSIYPGDGAGHSAQPNRLEVIQAADLQNTVLATEFSGVSTQRKPELTVSSPSINQIPPSEDRPASCRSALEVKTVSNSYEVTGFSNETACPPSVAVQEKSVARTNEVSVSASAPLPGIFIENNQIDVGCVGLLNRPSEHRCQEQPKRQGSRHALPSGVFQSLISEFTEKRSDEPSFVLKEGCKDPSSLVNSAKMEEPHQSVHPSMFQLCGFEKAASSLQADQDSMLTRQWTLLSRFQQGRRFLSSI